MSVTEASLSDISLQLVRILFAWAVKTSGKSAILVKSFLILTLEVSEEIAGSNLTIE